MKDAKQDSRTKPSRRKKLRSQAQKKVGSEWINQSLLIKSGVEVQGLVLSKSNPVIVQSQGGLVQMTPADKVKKRSNMIYSLMLSVDQLGLSAQDLADLISYLETLK